MTYYMTILQCVIIDKTSKQFEPHTYNRVQNIFGKCSIAAKKPTPQANENHCLRPSVEKQVFRTWLRLKTSDLRSYG